MLSFVLGLWSACNVDLDLSMISFHIERGRCPLTAVVDNVQPVVGVIFDRVFFVAALLLPVGCFQPTGLQRRLTAFVGCSEHSSAYSAGLPRRSSTVFIIVWQGCSPLQSRPLISVRLNAMSPKIRPRS